VLYETTGELSLVRENDPDDELIAVGLRDAVGLLLAVGGGSGRGGKR
jgi:hypothetical protein